MFADTRSGAEHHQVLLEMLNICEKLKSFVYFILCNTTEVFSLFLYMPMSYTQDNVPMGCTFLLQTGSLALSHINCALQQTATTYCTTSRLHLLLCFYCLIVITCNAKEMPADSSDSAKPQEGGISLLTTTTTKWFACGSCEAQNVLAHKVTEMLLLKGCH